MTNRPMSRCGVPGHKHYFALYECPACEALVRRASTSSNSLPVVQSCSQAEKGDPPMDAPS
jgi:hypothetical protein